MSYAQEHAAVLGMLGEDGARVTFTKDTRTHTPATGATTSTRSTMLGRAVQVSGNPIRYAALDLKQASNPTLLFVPDTYGDVPDLGTSVVWGSLAYTVRDVDVIAPDGTAIAAKIIVSR